MKLLFLGTGAADWDASQAHLGDHTALQRRTTSVLVNQDLLIDHNPTVPEAMASFGADGGKIRNVLISHSHGSLRWRNTGAAEKWDRKRQSFRRNPFLASFDYFIFRQRCVTLKITIHDGCTMCLYYQR